MSRASTSWFACYTPRPHARWRLIGFPHGGGGPQVFRDWGPLLPEDVELVALNLPGRGGRLSEPLIADMAELVPQVVDALRTYFDKPFAFFGHSVGALVAYETTRQLQHAQYPPPLRLFASAHHAPHHAPHHSPMYNLPDAELVALLRDLGLAPPEALENEELLEFILPPLKADFQLSETYICKMSAPLTVPIFALGGEADTLVTRDDLARWSAYTTAAFEVAMFDGGHFYTRSCQHEVIQAIVQTLQADIAALPQSILYGDMAPYPDKCLHDLFREQAAKTPGATAVVGEHGPLTFGELDAQTDLLARYLQHRGVGVDELVGIYMETSVAFVIAYIAALKAGGAYMPIETAYPEAYLTQVLETAQPLAVLTNDKFYARLPAAWRALALSLDDGWIKQAQALALETPPEERPKPTLDSLAYCVMSSGTTGAPKGILCPHRGAVNSYVWRYRRYPYQAGEREACNVFFVWEVMRPLLQGYPAYVIPDEVIYDPPRLLAFLNEHRITRVLLTPSLLAQVLHAPPSDLQAQLRHLRVVYLNGEVVTTVLRNRFRHLLPQVTLLNDYSISECHDVCTYDLADVHPVLSPKYAPLGAPMTNVYIYLLDDDLQSAPMGFQGEIYVGGDSVARGYLNEPERTAERFIDDPIRNDGSRLFRTGDTGRILPNGHLEIQGRVAFMVKLRGYSIVPGAVETTIAEHPAVNAAVVTTLDNEQTGQPEHLVAYVVGNGQLDDEALVEALRPYLRERLPHYATPSYIMPLTALPLASVGKLDRRQLPKPDPEALRSRRGVLMAPPATPLERSIADVWQEVLHTERVDVTANFFDLGGHSLLAAEVCARLQRESGLQVSVVDVFQYPTVRLLAQAYEHVAAAAPVAPPKPVAPRADASIAVIGLACRFPGADDAEQFWRNLRDGVCSIRSFSEAELSQRGAPASVYQRPGYVKAGAVLDGVDQFDPAFWGMSQREAVYMDPQHRLFLECCWHALEHAGYAPSQDGARTGVFAGAFLPSYLLHHLRGGGLMDPGNPGLAHLTEIGNDKDYLATRVSHLLNLRGPSLSVQTSCSTGLVAVATACQSLLAGQCDVALAGASSITFPQAGYQYQEGFIYSRDGQCRAFDAEASGTVLGDGVGVVALKRLEDAEAAGDYILAVITGFAVNNDGNLKADYSAPSVQGQVDVVTAAQAMAGVDAETISYIEAHGTGTLIGDPIEARALTSAFRRATARTAFCALGSVKPNIGHSNIAAGVAGLIKVILSLQHRQLPPTIHFTTPNPTMELESSPFFVNDRLVEWTPPDAMPRRAGVTCLGIGGTNCHMILEEWQPQRAQTAASSPTDQLLTLSAKTPASLEQSRLKLIDYLQAHPTLDLADAAYTLHVGREAFAHRLAVVCRNVPDAIAQLRQAAEPPYDAKTLDGGRTAVVFMFSGQGSQHLHMGRGLYQQFPAFRRCIDRCRDILKPLIQADLCELLYGGAASPALFDRADMLQPALFSVDYAMARLLMDWGVRPRAVVGHSLGEYVAACIAGVMSLEDALALVVTRGRAMEDAGKGAMLAVSLSEAEARDFLQQRGLQTFDDGPDVRLAAINAPRRVVLSGGCQAVKQAAKALRDAGVARQRVRVSRAFHSPMMQHAAEAVARQARQIALQTPVMPMASNLTGAWLTDDEALDPAYWGRHMMEPVRFEAAIQTILQQKPSVLLEVGPGRILSGLATEIIRKRPSIEPPLVCATMRHPRERDMTDARCLLQTLGRLWTAGIAIDWRVFHADARPRRLPLPTYAFERRRCWPDDAMTATHLNGAAMPSLAAEHQLPLADRFYLPSWRRTLPPPRQPQLSAHRWLIFLPGAGKAGALGDMLATRLEQHGHGVQRVYRANDAPDEIPPAAHVIGAAQAEDYLALLRQLAADSASPQRIMYLWGLEREAETAQQTLADAYYPFLRLAQALTAHGDQEALMLWVITDQAVQINDEKVHPEKATLLGPGLVLPQENPLVNCRTLDVQLSSAPTEQAQLADTILSECAAIEPDAEPLIAWRGEHRWRPHYEAVELSASAAGAGLQQAHQTYIITGGLGRIGLTLAEHLAMLPSKIVLTTRSAFPARSQWEGIALSSDAAPQLKATVQRLLKCEAAGADLRVIQADMAKASDVQRMLATTLDHFGDIAGIFHAAGLAHLQYLPQLTPEICEREFAPKLYGVLYLEQAIGQLSRKPKFVVLFSSMAAILGGLAMGAYAAANRFMDAFAQANPRRHGVSWLSVNWDDWDFAYDREQIAAYEKTQAQFAMSSAEGIEALDRIVAYGQPIQLLVATRALPPRIAQWLHQQTRSVSPTARITEAPADGNRLEQPVAAIYREVLGLADIAADDNFFDLGGDSLLASQVLLQLRRQLPQAQLQLPMIFDYPSVREMARYLAENHTG